MSMIGVLTEEVHLISGTGDFVEIGVLRSRKEARAFRLNEEKNFIEKKFDGITVGIPKGERKNFRVVLQDFTWIRYKSAGYRCAVFQKKKCMLGRDEKCWNMTR